LFLAPLPRLAAGPPRPAGAGDASA
jgi:hypothetical protein